MKAARIALVASLIGGSGAASAGIDSGLLGPWHGFSDKGVLREFIIEKGNHSGERRVTSCFRHTRHALELTVIDNAKHAVPEVKQGLIVELTWSFSRTVERGVFFHSWDPTPYRARRRAIHGADRSAQTRNHRFEPDRKDEADERPARVPHRNPLAVAFALSQESPSPSPWQDACSAPQTNLSPETCP